MNVVTAPPRSGHPLAAAIATLNAVGAGLGAIGLATGWLYLGDELTARLPWGSAVVGGIALAVIVALPNTLLALLALRRDPRCGPASVATGVCLVVWIVVQLGFIRSVTFLQPLYASVGLLQIWLGVRMIKAETDGGN